MTLAFSRGFDSGNYGNAYESQDWEGWYAENCLAPDGLDPMEYCTGLLLGFFSTYELHEIGDEYVREAVQTARIAHPELD